MRVIGALFGGLEEVAEGIKHLESLGCDSAFSAEIANDPFFPLVLAAEHSDNIELMTSIAVALARNPMTLANLSHDLNQYSKGRFVLGIGSQIKPHITKRFNMPWSKPASRMREYILAMRAIWDCWQNDTKLDFRGEFYQHTLMTPMFVPAKKDFGAPLVKLAAVGPVMTEVAGEVADGVIAHGFTTPDYLHEVTVPAVNRGLEKAGKKREEFDLICPVMVASGGSEEEFTQNVQMLRMQLAFYASTPAYQKVLDQHGWGDLQPRLTVMSKEGKWQEMGELINDEILNTFAVVCESPDDVAPTILQRYGDMIDSWECTWQINDVDVLKKTIAALQAH